MFEAKNEGYTEEQGEITELSSGAGLRNSGAFDRAEALEKLKKIGDELWNHDTTRANRIYEIWRSLGDEVMK